MSTIQDIRALEQRIIDIVEDYIDGLFFENDVLVISRHYGNITIQVHAKEKIKCGQSTEIYLLRELVRPDDDGNQEADIDKISAIANSWLFLS